MFLVAMPAEWYFGEMQHARLFEGSVERSLDSLEIKAARVLNPVALELDLGFDDGNASTFTLSWGPKKGEFAVKQTGGSTLLLSIHDDTSPMEQYFTLNPPVVYFVDGAEVHGGYVLDVSSSLTHFFDPATITALDWTGVDITTESKWRNGQMRPNSVQARIIDRLVGEPNQVVFDDDDSGEVADVLEIVEEKDTLIFRLYHCKYSGGTDPGARVKDPAEVCAQAVRSLRWIPNPRRLFEHLQDRERNHLQGRPTRFAKGRLRHLANFRRRLRKLRCRFEIAIVQPGISRAQCDPEITTMLGAASNLVNEITGTPLHVIASA